MQRVRKKSRCRPCVSCRRPFSLPASPVAFSEQIPVPFAFRPVSGVFYPDSYLPSFFQRVGCSTPNTPRLLHRRHFCSLACALQASRLSSLRVPRFPRRRCTNFAVVGAVAEGNDFTLFVGLHHHHQPIDAVGRLALSTLTSSRINRRHGGTTPIRARTPYPARRVTALVVIADPGNFCCCRQLASLIHQCQIFPPKRFYKFSTLIE